MAESKKRRKAAVALGAAGVAIFGALFATALSVGAGSGGGAPATVAEGETVDWAARAQSALTTGGFGFATAAMAGRVLQISGDAPDMAAREQAYLAGVEAVRGDEKHVGQVLAFENAITIAGQPVVSVPDAASALGAAPQAEACQTAYDTLLEGRVINFESGSALLAADSSLLLDALSAVAVRCVDYKVNVRGHTDAAGDANANQALSERRAQAVADYLNRKGVAATQLAVTGLGEQELLDTGDTPDADARNRRIEFKVEAQPAR